VGRKTNNEKLYLPVFQNITYAVNSAGG